MARTATWAREAGISVLWAFMFGSPGETEGTVRETLDFIRTGLRDGDRVICTVGIRVYPRTEIARTALAEGAIPPDADLSHPVFYFSPHITPDRVLEVLDSSPRRSQMVYLGALQQPAVAWALRLRHALRLPGAPWAAVPLYSRLTRLLRR